MHFLAAEWVRAGGQFPPMVSIPYEWFIALEQPTLSLGAADLLAQDAELGHDIRGGQPLLESHPRVVTRPTEQPPDGAAGPKVHAIEGGLASRDRPQTR